jgi:hypothetical protein
MRACMIACMQQHAWVGEDCLTVFFTLKETLPNGATRKERPKNWQISFEMDLETTEIRPTDGKFRPRSNVELFMCRT